MLASLCLSKNPGCSRPHGSLLLLLLHIGFHLSNVSCAGCSTFAAAAAFSQWMDRTVYDIHTMCTPHFVVGFSLFFDFLAAAYSATFFTPKS